MKHSFHYKRDAQNDILKQINKLKEEINHLVWPFIESMLDN